MSKIKTILGKKNENKFQEVQGILLRQMERLDDKKVMNKDGKVEIQRSGAISQSASAFVKSVQLQMRILDYSNKYNVDMEDMNKFLGIEKSDK